MLKELEIKAMAVRALTRITEPDKVAHALIHPGTQRMEDAIESL